VLQNCFSPTPLEKVIHSSLYHLRTANKIQIPPPRSEGRQEQQKTKGCKILKIKGLALGFLGEFGVLAMKKAVVLDFCYCLQVLCGECLDVPLITIL
jgi:hypothetical protein